MRSENGEAIYPSVVLLEYWGRQMRERELWRGEQRRPLKFATRPQPDIANWFYVPSWKRSSPLKQSGSSNEERSWLILNDESGLGRVLSEKLLAQHQRVITVSIGERFGREDANAFTLDPREQAPAQRGVLPGRAGRAIGSLQQRDAAGALPGEQA